VRNSVRKKVVCVEAQLGDFRVAQPNKLFFETWDPTLV
jgi:hypothetical protein